jgi:hypothetical protein
MRGRLYGDHRSDRVCHKSDETGGRHRARQRGDRLGVLCDRQDVVAPRRCAEAGKIDGNQTKTLGERGLKQRREAA